MLQRLRQRDTVRLLWCLLVLTIVVPAALLALVAWQTRKSALEEASALAVRTTQVLHGHATNVFGSFELIMDRIADRVQGRIWAEIEQSQEVHSLLKEIADKHPQVGTVLLFDEAGTARSSSFQFPTPSVNVADRDYMRAFRAGHRSTFVGETVKGRTTGKTAFNIARPMYDQGGQFKGAIVVAAYTSYFGEFYARASRGLDHSAGLVRSDGVFLVRDAEAKTSVEQPRASANFLREVTRSTEGLFPSRSTVDGIERLVAYQKIGGYPVYVLYAVGREAVLGAWRRQMFVYALFAIPAMVCLIAMTVVALVRTNREQAAANKLLSEMARREEAEERLRVAQKMEALGHLTGGIAHDFNNLLTVVMGSLDLLRRVKEERRARLIDNAMQAVEQGRRLTGQLLAFGRRQALRPEVLDLNTLISGASDMLIQSLRGDIKLVLDLQPDVWPVEVDETQLQIALINLAANARDAMPKGGEFTIRTENSAGEVEAVVISVTDTGTGIPRDALSRVFEPFFTTKAIGKGTGLGLAQVYGFTRQSGGSVEVRSEESRGTTFLVTLPRATNAQSPALPASDQPTTGKLVGRRLRVLLVEDNEQVAEVAAALLRENGHEVTHASNATDALRILGGNQQVDIVFSDLVMPGDMDGVALARNIRRLWPELPVLLATGYSEAPASEAERAGYSLLRKPYQPHMLDEALQKVAGSHSAGRDSSGKVIPLKKP